MTDLSIEHQPVLPEEMQKEVDHLLSTLATYAKPSPRGRSKHITMALKNRVKASIGETNQSVVKERWVEYVYCIKMNSPTPVYKIGFSRQPHKRFKQLASGTMGPWTMELTAVIKTKCMSRLEANLHQMFKEKRVNGEWFALSDEDVQYIKSLEE